MSQLLAAERYQIPISQVYRLTRDGAIPAVRLGRYYRYRLDHLEQFEDSFTNNITSELRRAAA
jgi:excisionase family DNA binding protein